MVCLTSLTWIRPEIHVPTLTDISFKSADNMFPEQVLNNQFQVVLDRANCLLSAIPEELREIGMEETMQKMPYIFHHLYWLSTVSKAFDSCSKVAVLKVTVWMETVDAQGLTTCGVLYKSFKAPPWLLLKRLAQEWREQFCLCENASNFENPSWNYTSSKESTPPPRIFRLVFGGPSLILPSSAPIHNFYFPLCCTWSCIFMKVFKAHQLLQPILHRR